MENLNFGLAEGLWWGAAAGMAVIVFVASRKSLQKIPAFRGGNSTVLAIGVTLLALMGMGQFFGVSAAATTPSTPQEPTINFILLPYAVLVLTLMIIFVLWGLSRLFRWQRKEPYSQKIHRCTHRSSSNPIHHDIMKALRSGWRSDRNIAPSDEINKNDRTSRSGAIR